MALTISPLYCSDGLTADTSQCYSSANDQVNVYNKRRDKFTIQVGAGLTLKNIIFDSLDSIILDDQS